MRLITMVLLLSTFIFVGCSDLQKSNASSIKEVKIVFLFEGIPYQREKFPIHKEQVDYKFMVKYFDGSKEFLSVGIHWNSSDENVAEIGESNGTAILKNFGSTEIDAATTIDGVEFSANILLTVREDVLQSIEISPDENQTIDKGTSQSYQLTAYFLDFDFPVPVTKLADWSNLENIITIVKKKNILGITKAVAETNASTDEGNYTIVANFLYLSKSVRLVVGPSKLKSVVITSDKNNSVTVGDDITFYAIGIYTDEHENNITEEVSWSSSESDKLSFPLIGNDKNIATAGDIEGDVNVTAKYGKFPSVVQETVSVKVTQ